MKTKKTLSLIVALGMLTASFTACGNSADTSSDDATSQTSLAEESISATESESEISEAETGFIETIYNPDFSIEILSDGIKKVIDGNDRELILVPKELDEVPEEYADSIVIRTPVENAVFLSSTQVCTFRTVDNADVISGIGGVEGDASSWSDIPAIAEGLENGDILNIGGDSEPDYEQIQALNPDVVFVYGGDYGQVDEMAKFDELGINYAVDNEYMESSYLARMEWMRFLLTFFNADSEADETMSDVETDINAAKADIEGLDKPVIAIFSLYDGTVYPTKVDSWLGSMIEDMGGINAFSDADTSNMTYEAAFDCISDADIVIYASTPKYTDGMDGVADVFPQITECKAYSEGKVYQYSETFWHGIDQSDIMACDLAAVLYPEVFDGRELSYFINLED
jgi:iron complex transport system substrate-binding protein